MFTYLQTAWGDQWDDITMSNIHSAIQILKKIDDEHGAFWVGRGNEGEDVLEVNKDLELIAVFDIEPETPYRGKCKDWKQVEYLFECFLSGKLEDVKKRLIAQSE